MVNWGRHETVANPPLSYSILKSTSKLGVSVMFFYFKKWAGQSKHI